MQEKAMKLGWFGCGATLGLLTLSIALGGVPRSDRVTDDTVIYQNLSEIRAAKEADLNFDNDISHLSNSENHYREKLPSLADHPRLKAPMQRINSQKYRYSGNARLEPIKKLNRN